MTAIKDFIKRYPVAIYFALTFAIILGSVSIVLLEAPGTPVQAGGMVDAAWGVVFVVVAECEARNISQLPAPKARASS